jgi:hypothetical protein
VKYEKTQPGNPHKLTVDQHVMPVGTIRRFAGADGRVEVQLAGNPNLIRLNPRNGMFRTRRTWHEKAERLFMKQIEDAFQQLADRVLAGEVAQLGEEDSQTVNSFYALWYHRSRYPHAKEPFVKPRGVTPSQLTKNQQEILEKKGAFYVVPDGMPSRFLAGMHLQLLVGHYAHQIAPLKWGVIRPLEGEFVMPDIPYHSLMPIDPRTCLVASHPSGHITVDNLKGINANLIAMSSRYFIAHNMRAACNGLTWDAVKRAGEASVAALEALPQ